MDSQVEEIKNRLNILDVVSGYVKLQKTGINYRGICPFHSEKGPSFFVSPSRQMFKCFGCGAGGSIFDFIMKIEGLDFGDALKILASKAGVELKKENPRLRTERQRLYEICEVSCSFFEKQIEGSEWGSKAKEYLLKRGITEESIKKWRLGYSPDTWQSLSDFLVSKGYKRDEIIKAGLAVQSEKSGNAYDRFRGRIMFPIFDLNSQVIGFGARIFKDADKKETAKYINTPQTLLYDKSNVLYGINNAKLAIRKNNQCVLTEGYTDAIMCHQAGFENTVAVSGTALTNSHLIFLKRYTDNLLLAFDMDLAGDNATKRGINLAEEQGFNLKIIDTYLNAKDPAEIILENPGNWEDSIKKARSIMEYYFDSALSRFDKETPGGKKEIGKIILPAIKRFKNKIEQSYWIQKLAEKLNVKEDIILDELKNIKSDNTRVYQNEIKTNTILSAKKMSLEGRVELLEERVIALLLKDFQNFSLVDEVYGLLSLRSRKFLDDVKNIIMPASHTSGLEEQDLIGIISKEIQSNDKIGDDFKNILNIIFLKMEVDCADDGLEELKLCIKQLKDIEAKEKMGEAVELIKKEGNEQKKEELLKDFQAKAKEFHSQKK